MATVLVIEDQAVVRENIATILQFEDFMVLKAADGKAGIELACNYLPDLILCDVNMPELDGYDVLRAVRNLPNTKQTPFIFLTGKGNKADMRKGMGLGADDYLTKPFTTQELLDAVHIRLERQASMVNEYENSLEEVKQK